MKRKLIIVVMGFLVAAAGALAQTDKPTPRPTPKWKSEKGASELKLTDEQKKDIKKIKFDLMQKQIDLRSKIAHARLEYQQLTSADSPDQDAISSKIDEIATIQSQLKKNLLGGWFAINKILTPDQQKIWKKVLEHPKSAASRMMIRMRMNGQSFGGQNRGTMQMRMPGVGMGPMMEGGRDFGETQYGDAGMDAQSELGPLADADIFGLSDETLPGDLNLFDAPTMDNSDMPGCCNMMDHGSLMENGDEPMNNRTEIIQKMLERYMPEPAPSDSANQ